MIARLPFCFGLLLLSLLSQAQTDLKVSDNQRFITYQDGKPFFYLGDTAWELFHRLNREESRKYLKNRADKGFTVIQAVILAEHDGLRTPNAYGEIPLRNEDPAQPNEAYFQHVDAIINQARDLGLHMAVLPTWGDKINKDKWGIGPEVFTEEKAYQYGKYLGNRYKKYTNLIWVIGGDRNPRKDSKDVDIWRALAKGITEGVGGKDKALMTFHPQTRSSQWFHQDDWLDFNMFQTGHCMDIKVWEHIAKDYALQPAKPTMDGEPVYEEIPICFDLKNGYVKHHEVRRRAYLSLFAGAHGYTYGCNNIWQMYVPGQKAYVDPSKPWYESLDLPGAGEMKHVRTLMESRPYLDRVPDQSLIVSENPADYTQHMQATRGKNYAFIYSGSGLPIEVKMGVISGKKVRTYWYNPRNGETTPLGVFINEKTRLFTPPSRGEDQDWILILDDTSAKFKKP